MTRPPVPTIQPFKSSVKVMFSSFGYALPRRPVAYQSGNSTRDQLAPPSLLRYTLALNKAHSRRSPRLSSSEDDIGTLARFGAIQGLVLDRQGRVFVADRENHTVRRIDANGRVSTVSGRVSQALWRDGPGEQARFGPYAGRPRRPARRALGPLPGGLGTPHGLALTPQGLVIISPLALLRLVP